LRRSAFGKNPEVLGKILKADEEIVVERNNYKREYLKFIELKILKFH
jgi:hypothetical protein